MAGSDPGHFFCLCGAKRRRFHGEWIATGSEARLRLLNPFNLETTMLHDHPSDGLAAIRTQFGAIFVSLELSRSTWLVTSLSPGKGEKMSRRSVEAGALAGLLKLFAELKRKAQMRTGESYPIITVQEAGLDGFWLHRALQQEGIESHVVDPASIATSRRRRRAKTDRLDGETLLRALLAYKRGEPRVCAMVVAPSPEEEDRRRLCRERRTLIAERIERRQGVSKAGNPRLRTTMIQLAWLWVRHQPQSALTQWFKAHSQRGRKRAIVALARKLLVALWKYVTQGVVIEGAVMKTA